MVVQTAIQLLTFDIILCILYMVYIFFLCLIFTFHWSFWVKRWWMVSPGKIKFLWQMKDLGRFLVILIVFMMAVGVMFHVNMYPNHEDMFSHKVQYWRIWKIISFPYWQIYGEIFLDDIMGNFLLLFCFFHTAAYFFFVLRNWPIIYTNTWVYRPWNDTLSMFVYIIWVTWYLTSGMSIRLYSN